MHKFVKIALVIAIVGGALVVSANAGAFGNPQIQLAQMTLDPPDRQPGATSGGAKPVTKKPESRPASLPVPSIALDPPVNQAGNQADELGLGSASPITSIERPERGTVPLAQPLSVEQSAPALPSPPAVSSPQPPVPASPAASIQPPPVPPAPAKPTPVPPAPVAEPRDQDKNENRGRREGNEGKEKWSGGDKGYDKKGYRDADRVDGPDGSYRIERADKVERTDKVDRPDKIERAEKVDKVEKIEIVRPEKIEKIEKVDKSGRPDRVERLQKVEKPERGKK
jgi:hypothetical protein